MAGGMKERIKNLKVRTRLYVAGAGFLIFILLSFLLSVWSVNQMKSRAAGYVEHAVQEGAWQIPEGGLSAMAEELQSLSVHWMVLLFALSVVSTLLAVVFLSAVIRSMTEPLQSIEGSLKKLSEGDFSERIDAKAPEMDEEIGSLAGLIEKIRGNVSNMAAGIRKGAAGLAQAADQIHTYTGGLHQDIAEISASAKEASSAVEKTAEASDAMQDVLVEIRASSELLASRVRSGLEEADVVFARAAEAKEEAAGQREMAERMQRESGDSLEHALNEMKILEQIPSLTESVIEITEKINILSLNAGIEAARAGQAGNGFALVADEIRKLAEQSKATAENIQWISGELDFALSHLKSETEHLMEFIDKDVAPCFEFMDHVSDVYHEDAESMKGLAFDVRVTAEKLFAAVDHMTDAAENVTNTVNSGKEETAGITYRTAAVQEKADSITGISKEIEKAVMLIKDAEGHIASEIEK